MREVQGRCGGVATETEGEEMTIKTLSEAVEADHSEEIDPSVSERAALAYLMFGDLLPDKGERLVRIMVNAKAPRFAKAEGRE